MLRSGIVLAVLAAGLVVSEARADDLTLEEVPPVVVKTVPQAGAADVDPKLTEIAVTFSKPMLEGSWSWVRLTKGQFPTTDGKAKYLADRKTCVLPVKLEPNTTYAMWINSTENGNFKDADGQPAVPYLLVFKTRK